MCELNIHLNWQWYSWLNDIEGSPSDECGFGLLLHWVFLLVWSWHSGRTGWSHKTSLVPSSFLSPGSLEQSQLIPVLVCTERNAFAPSTAASQYAAFCPPTTNPPVTVRIKRGQRRMRLQDAPVFSALSLIGVSERLRALAEWDWFFLLTSTLGFLSGLLIGGLVSGLLLARSLWHW